MSWARWHNDRALTGLLLELEAPTERQSIDKLRSIQHASKLMFKPSASRTVLPMVCALPPKTFLQQGLEHGTILRIVKKRNDLLEVCPRSRQAFLRLIDLVPLLTVRVDTKAIKQQHQFQTLAQLDILVALRQS